MDENLTGFLPMLCDKLIICDRWLGINLISLRQIWGLTGLGANIWIIDRTAFKCVIDHLLVRDKYVLDFHSDIYIIYIYIYCHG